MTLLVECKRQSKYTFIQMDDGKANALGFDMLTQLGRALDQAEQAGNVVVISGRPGMFCAGFDLSIMRQGGEETVRLLRQGAVLARRLLSIPTPVVLAVNGHALAMGALLLLSADYRIGVHGNFKIGLSEVAIGMTMPWFGVELARARLAKPYFNPAVALARIYNSEEALQAGYLDEVVSAEDLMTQARSMAEQFSALDMEAHKQTKSRIRETLITLLGEVIEKELGAA